MHLILETWQYIQSHDDVIKWKHFPHYWAFVWGIHWSLVNSPHKGQWCRALMFSLICAWTNGSVNNRDPGDLRCHWAHYDITVMYCIAYWGTSKSSLLIVTQTIYHGSSTFSFLCINFHNQHLSWQCRGMIEVSNTWLCSKQFLHIENELLNFLFVVCRSSGRGPCIKDEIEEAKQLAERQAAIAAYRAHRADVEARRERDRQMRNHAKIAQLELCEQMQVRPGAQFSIKTVFQSTMCIRIRSWYCLIFMNSLMVSHVKKMGSCES